MAIRGTRRLETRHAKDLRVSEAVARAGVIAAGVTPVETAIEMKALLNIEGDAMGTLNTQEMFNKTVDGGGFATG